jgi:hypothetical protein
MGLPHFFYRLATTLGVTEEGFLVTVSQNPCTKAVTLILLLVISLTAQFSPIWFSDYLVYIKI